MSGEWTRALQDEVAEALAEWRDMDIHYSFPLSGGQRATIILPRDVTDEDARRLGAFVRSLAAGSSGPGEEAAR